MEIHQQIFDEWLGQHQGLLWKIIRAYAFTPDDQDDQLQEITFQLWKSIPGYQDEVAVTTWIYRVSLYTAIGWTRKEKTHRGHKQPLGDAEHLLFQPTRPTDPRLEWLYKQIANLSDIDRSLTVLMFEGCSYKEMATVLGMTESHIGVKINRIKKHLTEKMQEKTSNEL